MRIFGLVVSRLPGWRKYCHLFFVVRMLSACFSPLFKFEEVYGPQQRIRVRGRIPDGGVHRRIASYPHPTSTSPSPSSGKLMYPLALAIPQ